MDPLSIIHKTNEEKNDCIVCFLIVCIIIINITFIVLFF